MLRRPAGRVEANPGRNILIARNAQSPGYERMEVWHRDDVQRLADGLGQESADVAGVRMDVAVHGENDRAGWGMTVIVIGDFLAVAVAVAARTVRMMTAAVAMRGVRNDIRTNVVVVSR